MSQESQPKVADKPVVIFPGSPNLTNLTKIRRIRKGDTGRGQGLRKTSIHADKHYKFVMLIHEAELSESGRERCSKPQCGPRSINGRSSTTSARQRPSRTCARSTQTALRAQRQRRCRQSRTRSLEREFGTWQAEHRNTLLRECSVCFCSLASCPSLGTGTQCYLLPCVPCSARQVGKKTAGNSSHSSHLDNSLQNFMPQPSRHRLRDAVACGRVERICQSVSPPGIRSTSRGAGRAPHGKAERLGSHEVHGHREFYRKLHTG